MIDANAGAEQLEAAAGAGRLDHRGLHAGRLAELLGHGGGERINGRRTDNADLVAGQGRHRGEGHQAGGEDYTLHVQNSPVYGQADTRAGRKRLCV